MAKRKGKTLAFNFWSLDLNQKLNQTQKTQKTHDLLRLLLLLLLFTNTNYLSLLKPPSLYNKYVLWLNNLNNKILDTLSSSPRKEYLVIIKATKNYLILGSL